MILKHTKGYGNYIRKILMLMFLTIPIIVIFLINFDSFGPGTADYRYKVGGGSYILSRSSKNYILLTKYLSDTKTKEIISPKIEEIAWDNNYILAKQNYMELKVNDDGTKEMEYKKINYWIIDIKKDLVFGPLTEKNFNLIKKELKIGSNLQLKNVEKYKK